MHGEAVCHRRSKENDKDSEGGEMKTCDRCLEPFDPDDPGTIIQSEIIADRVCLRCASYALLLIAVHKFSQAVGRMEIGVEQ